MNTLNQVVKCNGVKDNNNFITEQLLYLGGY
jgi:hypothetical protein